MPILSWESWGLIAISFSIVVALIFWGFILRRFLLKREIVLAPWLTGGLFGLLVSLVQITGGQICSYGKSGLGGLSCIPWGYYPLLFISDLSDPISRVLGFMGNLIPNPFFSILFFTSLINFIVGAGIGYLIGLCRRK